MPTQLDTIRQQMENAVQTQIDAAQAKVRSQTSITRAAMSGLHTAAERVTGAGRKNSGELRRRRGVYRQKEPDGYRRRSPVQEIQTAPNYRAAVVKRAIAALFGVLVVAAGVWLLCYLL